MGPVPGYPIQAGHESSISGTRDQDPDDPERRADDGAGLDQHRAVDARLKSGDLRAVVGPGGQRLGGGRVLVGPPDGGRDGVGLSGVSSASIGERAISWASKTVPPVCSTPTRSWTRVRRVRVARSFAAVDRLHHWRRPPHGGR